MCARGWLPSLPLIPQPTHTPQKNDLKHPNPNEPRP
jgi:hypothetical protein